MYLISYLDHRLTPYSLCSDTDIRGKYFQVHNIRGIESLKLLLPSGEFDYVRIGRIEKSEFLVPFKSISVI